MLDNEHYIATVIGVAWPNFYTCGNISTSNKIGIMLHFYLFRCSLRSDLNLNKAEQTFLSIYIICKKLITSILHRVSCKIVRIFCSNIAACLLLLHTFLFISFKDLTYSAACKFLLVLLLVGCCSSFVIYCFDEYCLGWIG